MAQSTVTESRGSMDRDIREDFLSRVVKGCSFADVGGLWGVVNEKVSIADELGAKKLTMIDITPDNAELWEQFRERMVDKGVGSVGCVSTDVCRVSDLHFDVVHCSGVLYHHPDPMQLLAALFRLADNYLVLTSAVSPQVIENEHGTYRLPGSGAILIPALDSQEKKILGKYWAEAGAVIDGIHTEVTYSVDDFGPWWWLPASRAMKAMCEAVGFRVIDEGPAWNGNAHCLLLDSSGEHPPKLGG
jgi:hypothetical protein